MHMSKIMPLFSRLSVLALLVLSFGQVNALTTGTAQESLNFNTGYTVFHSDNQARLPQNLLDRISENATYEVARKSNKKKRSRKYSKVDVLVDLSKQRMQVKVNGRVKHNWKVSSGRAGFSTPTGSYRPTRMHRKYFSKKYYNSPMPNSIFFYGGYAIHGTYATKSLGRRASHGCIRLSPANSRRLFDIVKRYGSSNTRIRIVH